DGGLAGIVSERDYARKVILLGRSSADTPVWQIMSAPVMTVSSDDTTQTCMLLMTERKFRHLPVVDAGRVIGMLSIGDLIKHALAEKQHEIDQLQRYIAS
ncbi:MAG TPA: CBS domain-containing protein, partial [Pseudomonadota bacterium]|nr:CBS domain-containing protein [Pseudomonadota bacterium]